MTGKSPVQANGEQMEALGRLSRSSDREEADRARAILLSLAGWTSGMIAQAFGVREDTVRDWRSRYLRQGLAGIVRHPAPGRAPVKAEAALAVAREVLAGPLADRTGWTLPRLAQAIEARTGQTISRSRLSVVLRKKGALPTSGPATR